MNRVPEFRLSRAWMVFVLAWIGLLPRPAQAWSWGVTSQVWETQGTMFSSPAIGTNGIIYVASKSTNAPCLWALNPNGTTQQVWTMEDRSFASPTIGPDGTIYIGGESDKFYGFNPDGTTQHVWNTAGRVISHAAIARDRTIYVVCGETSDHTLYAFHPDGTTNRTWQVCADSGSITAPPVLTTNDDIVIMGSDQTLFLFDADGTTQRTWTVSGGSHSPAAIGPDGTIYIGSVYSNVFYAFHPDGSTQQVWKTIGDVDYCSAAVGTNGIVYVGDMSGYVYGFAPDGTTQHVWVAGSAIYSSLALGADGTIYVGCNDRTNFYAFHADGTTNLAWVLGEGRIQASPAVAPDGTVYIGSYDYNEFYGLEGTGGALMASAWPEFGQNQFNTGRPLWSPTNIAASQMEYDDRIVVSWTAGDYALGYEVWRSTNASADNAIWVGATQELTFSDTGAQALRSYYYWIRSTNAMARGPLEGEGALGERACTVTPDNGPWNGGNSVVFTNGLMGTGGSDITNVTFDGVSATAITGQGVNWVRVQAPPGPSGSVTVVIYSTVLGATTVPNAYLYNPPGQIGMDVWDAWTEVASMPTMLKFMGGAVLDDALFTIGGADASVNKTNVYRFDGDSWRQVRGLPDIRSRVGAAAYNGQIYAVAGYRTSVSVTNVFVNDGINWTQVAGLPAARHSPAVEVMGDHLYAIGGQNAAGAETNVYRFDGTNWTQVAGLPAGRYGAAASVWNDALYVLGGYNASDVAQTNVYRFDGTNWTEIAGLPEAQAYLGAASSEGLLYAMGGASSSNTYRYDGTNWTPGAGMPAQRYGYAGGVIGGHYHAAGGSGPAGTPRANTYRHQARIYQSGVDPESGSIAGGFAVIITGSNLCSGVLSDVLEVTLCGISAVIDSVSPTQIVVTASAAPGALSGDVVVSSTAFGTTTGSNRFAYVDSDILVLGTNGMSIANGAAPNFARGTEFGMWRVGAGGTNAFAIVNSGTSDLLIDGWTTNGATADVFSVAGIPASVAPGATSEFTVAYAPFVPATYTASLVIANNSSGTDSNFVVRLRGSAYSLTAYRGPAFGGNLVTVSNGLLGSGADITNVTVGGASAGIVTQGLNWVRIVMPAHQAGTATVAVASASRGVTPLIDAYLYDPYVRAVASPYGSLAPSGLVLLPYGGSTSFVAAAHAYYHIGEVLTNGVSVPEAAGLSVFTSTWNNVMATGGIVAVFAENTTIDTGTPEWWLAQHGWTNDFEAAATNDTDLDGVLAWQEYLGDTIPTNGESYLHLTGVSTAGVEWVGGTGVVQYLEWSRQVDTNEWVMLATNLPPTPVTNTASIPDMGTSNGFLRVRAER